MKLILPVLLLLPAAVFVSCDKSDSTSDPAVVTIIDLLPRDNEISGWNRSARAWAARNKEELQNEIDGGFEIFFNQGFVEGAMQSYTGSVNAHSVVDCYVEVYDQRDSQGSRGLFDDPEKAFSNPIAPARPPSADAQIQKDVFSYRMKFTKGKYYVTITVGSSDDKAQEVIEIFGNNIAAKIR